MRRLVIILGLSLAAVFAAPDAATSDSRERHASDIRRALNEAGVQPSMTVERKIATMSDQDLRRLASEQEQIGRPHNPMLIIGGCIALLILVVVALVRKVD